MTGFNSWMRLILYVYENNNLDCVILKVIFVYVIVWFRVQFGKKNYTCSEFFKYAHAVRRSKRVQFDVFKKLTSVCFFKLPDC